MLRRAIPQVLSSILRGQSSTAVAAVTLLGYLLIFLVFSHNNTDLRDFAMIGKNYVTKSDISPSIKLEPDLQVHLRRL